MSLKNTSIKNKLRIIILLTSTLVLCLSTTAFVISEIFTFRRDMVTNLFVLADLVGINSTTGLMFDNDDNAKEDILALEANPHIILAHVFSEDGEIFTSYFRQDAKETYEFTNVYDYYAYHNENTNEFANKNHNPNVVEDKYFFEDEHIDVFKKITFRDQFLGTVFVQSDLDILHERLILGIAIIATVLLLSSILAFLLASYFQRIITTPIDELLKIMEATSKTQNYSNRAKKTADDEMGTLTDGFNNMLSKIETGTQELAKARDQALATNQELEKARDQTMATNQELEKARDQTMAANQELAKARDQALAANQELEKARDQALTANKAKSIFLANMSHELRTPLNGILGFTQILKTDENLNSDQRSGIDVIHRSGEHLLSLLTDILDLSKIEADRIELSTADFHLCSFLKNIVDLFKMRSKAKGLTFVYEELSHLPKFVHADEKRLRQILINLLGNAFKFTKEGQVSLTTSYFNEQILFQVKDTGAGIAEEEIADIFKPFQQVGDKALHAEGTGLGLTITKKLVEMMGGKLNVDSTLGKGTTFWLTVDLPKVENFSEECQDEDYNESIIVGFKEAGCRILVADDKSENRHLLIQLLMPLGFEIAEATDGQECLEKALEWQPDLILMDLIMPTIDGFEATRHIRQTPQLKDTIIIMITASAFEWHKQQSEKAGCDDFIAKPILLKELLASLKKYLKLTWIYKDDEIVQEKKGLELSDKDLMGPSSEQAEILLDLVMMGDICGISEEIEKMEKDNEEITPFANKIRALSKNYEMGNIQRLIEQYINTDQIRNQDDNIILEQKNDGIIGPSKEQSALLLDFAKAGDLDSIMEHIEKYEQSNENLKNFANEIRKFAKNFEINAIRIYIENYMKNK